MRERVYIAVPALDGRVEVTISHLLSLAERMNHDLDCPWYFVKEYFVGYRPVAYMRNSIFGDFLASDCARLWMLDADIVPPTNAFEILTVDDDIVGGMIPGHASSTEDDGFVIRCLAFRETEDGFETILPPPETSKVDAVGGGCMLVRREVLERACESAETSDEGVPAIYALDSDVAGKTIATGDVCFCRDARRAGYSVSLWTGGWFGQRETLNLLDVAGYGARCAGRAAEAVTK